VVGRTCPFVVRLAVQEGSDVVGVELVALVPVGGESPATVVLAVVIGAYKLGNAGKRIGVFQHVVTHID
jgi:hypothetical protein